jgi:hypothetical protein
MYPAFRYCAATRVSGCGNVLYIEILPPAPLRSRLYICVMDEK